METFDTLEDEYLKLKKDLERIKLQYEGDCYYGNREYMKISGTKLQNIAVRIEEIETKFPEYLI